MITRLNRDEVEQLTVRYEELLAETESLKLAAESGEGSPLDNQYQRLSAELIEVTLRLHAHSSQPGPARHRASP